MLFVFVLLKEDCLNDCLLHLDQHILGTFGLECFLGLDVITLMP